MTAIATLLVVLTLSLLTVRVATVMLVLTGLSLPLARFQARSAFTGCGFSTSESEQVVSHPVRRKIISTLMLLGNAGIVTTVGTLIAGLMAQGDNGFSMLARLATLVVGVVILWMISSSRWVERAINRWTFKLLRRYTKLEIRDYANLMHLGGEYGISEVRVEPGSWLGERPLQELRLSHEGVLVLGINRRDGSYLGTPQSDTVAHPGDVLILYGSTERLAELDKRRADDAGTFLHLEAVADQKAKAAGNRATEAATNDERVAAEQQQRAAEVTRDAVHEHAEAVGHDGRR